MRGGRGELKWELKMQKMEVNSEKYLIYMINWLVVLKKEQMFKTSEISSEVFLELSMNFAFGIIIIKNEN